MIEIDGSQRVVRPEPSVAELKVAAEVAAQAKAKEAAAAQAKKAAEKRAREKADAEARAKREAEERAKEEAVAIAAAQARAKRAAEAKSKKAAEEKAKQEALEIARREKAEEQARKKAEAKAAAEEKARKAAEAKAKKEADAKAKAEAAEAARIATQLKAKQEAEAKAKAAAEEKARKQAAAKAKKEAEAKAAVEARQKADKEERLIAEAAEAEAKAAKEARAKAADLGKAMKRLIRETGPISLAQYMGESNARYYASRDPLGDEADFITAPEVSQMFGELIGLWLADLWVRMGSRKRIHFVELGPGRGTLAADALRMARRYEMDPQVHLVEASPVLRKAQLERVPDAVHHEDLSTVPDDAPLLIVANEFFDALPVHQLVRSANGWHERMVGLEENQLAFVAGDKPMDSIVPSGWRSASQGTLIETSPAASAVMEEIGSRLKNQGGVALIIDYGPFELRAGSTLQAIKAHKKVDPLTHPGEADLTAHVDFEMLSQVAKKNGADVMGVQMQGEWLRELGIEVRHEALLRKSPDKADILNRQLNRLVADGEMGALFKVLGICGRRWPAGVGFE